ncbi:NAD-dependent epimerase/dehydratase family protein [Natronorubrum sp. JWXQ-INN-674]|uniref:NAD-dependent epimerase/dehydratase family protein n=1 Tax=Natronorubrum halalkaliphilum TaxID=2691917 RepID=A0A6B0VJZ7_9EURY|nr:UDP-glucuronic acid decarboxylase family protein [Natronorubrum halalkaliphilum]MXV61870.1 NAD-dependent epimerase/dehydratase family protein [Natronorubrum halalkaliphilum]
MSNRILVTGGAGFLGSHLCEYLLAEGNEVICLDNFGSGHRDNMAQFADHPSFTISDRNVRIPGSLPSVDQIYHLASRASPADFTDFPVNIALANTQGTRRLLDHARACDARMVFASTSEVYGDPKVHPQPETYTGNVNIRGIRGCYDESKRFGETLTVAYKRKYNIDARTIRIFNTYGPRMRPNDGRVVPTFVTQALQGDDLTIYGDGEQTRSFCYVDDLVEGLTSLMRINDPEHYVYNIGNENERTIKELAHEVLDLTKTNSNISYEPLPQDDPSQRRPDITRAKTELDWEPKVPLRDGLKQTISYFESVV